LKLSPKTKGSGNRHNNTTTVESKKKKEGTRLQANDLAAVKIAKEVLNLARVSILGLDRCLNHV